MELLIGACGLLCNFCPAYVGTKNNDVALIEKTAKEWSAMYGVEIRPDDVWCTGCMTDGERKCVHCASGCEIRKCVVKKGYPTCALCEDRPKCDIIFHVSQHVPPTVQLLDALAGFKNQFDPEK